MRGGDFIFVKRVVVLIRWKEGGSLGFIFVGKGRTVLIKKLSSLIFCFTKFCLGKND